MSPDDPSALAPTAETAATPQSSPAAVSECGLVLVRVRLSGVVCLPGAPGLEAIPGPARLECTGALVDESRSPAGFSAVVSWSVAFPADLKPLTISGQHVLTFTLASPVSEETASYYAKVNSIVLAHPYIRQIVDDLSVKTLGQSIVVEILDVPKFICEYHTEQHRLESPPDENKGADADGTEDPG